MQDQALLLAATSALLPQEAKLARILRFFGIEASVVALAELLDKLPANAPKSCRLLCSPESFLGLLEALNSRREERSFWWERLHSVFVCGGSDLRVLQKLAQHLTRSTEQLVTEIDPGRSAWNVAKDVNLCGVMSGVRIDPQKPVARTAVFQSAGPAVTPLLSTARGAVSVRFEHHNVPVFVSFSGEVIDLETELRSGNFDVRDHALSAVPTVLYIRWAFAESCWHTPETNGCLVIDDPLLKPRYGCVNFEELLALMERHNFSTNIAFIPWNWRRSHPSVVRLFATNSHRYSLSIHGCDHTAGEFASHDSRRLRWMAVQAASRMSGHRTRTGLEHDNIMVFPQGAFSATAMRVLKQSRLTAVVNTEVVTTPPDETRIRISDVWDVAVMRYSCFPIFTRRYPAQGVENFAFDILLGKPCIIVIHHDFCRDQCAELTRFITALNGLKSKLAWRSLGEVVRRSYRQRVLSPGTMEVEMYGTELRLCNWSTERKRFLIRKRETDRPALRELQAATNRVAWTWAEDFIHFETELEAGESTLLRMTFEDGGDDALYGAGNGGWRSSAKTMLRRRLCEVRDNYLVPAKAWLSQRK